MTALALSEPTFGLPALAAGVASVASAAAAAKAVRAVGCGTLAVSRKNVPAARTLTRKLPSWRALLDAVGGVNQARGMPLTREAARTAIASLFEALDIDVDARSAARVDNIVGAIVGDELADALGLDESPVEPSALVLALAVQTLRRNLTRRPTPAVVRDAMRRVSVRLDRLLDELRDALELREHVDDVLEEFDGVPALPPPDDGLDDSIPEVT